MVVSMTPRQYYAVPRLQKSFMTRHGHLLRISNITVVVCKDGGITRDAGDPARIVLVFGAISYSLN